jgi:hypothetical protein
VRSDVGTASSTALSSAPMKPVRSAKPIPSIPTSTTPSGGNSMKFFTSVLRIQ